VRRRELVLGAAGAILVRPASAAAVDGDPAIVARLMLREESAAYAYRHRPFADFELHEADHARALRTHLSALGRSAPEPPRDASQLDRAARRVVEADAVLDAQIELEGSLLAAYREALIAIAEPSILRTAATIAASHAQHEALLRREAGLGPPS
jgi:Ferritin-like domain